MKTRGLKRGFTLVELLIVVAILAILSGAAYIGIMRSQARVMNEKVIDDLIAISNALEQYKRDTGHYPTIDAPLKLTEDKNVSCFKADTTYSHDCTSDKAAFLQTQVDNLLLTKRYLQEVPTDPRTHSRYIYGVTTDGNYYQVAGNYLDENDIWVAKVRGNVRKGYRLPSLIRAFDGADFVMDGESYLPYSPDHLSLTARVVEKAGDAYIDTVPVDENNYLVRPGSIVTTEEEATAILYFSDGSVTYLDESSELKIQPATEVRQNDEDGIVTKIYLKLFSGKVWNKVARLAQKSEFNVETTSAIAGVRGTEFGIDAESTQLIVLSGTVVARGLDPHEADIAEDPESDGIEYSALPEAGNFRPDQVITGTGEYVQYPIPEHGAAAQPDNSEPLAQPEIQDIENKFSAGAFNNNYHPKVLEVDTTVAADPKIIFEYAAGVEKIYAIDLTAAELQSWEGALDGIIVSADETTLTVTPDLALYDEGKMVRFYFESENGDQTGLSDPAVFIGPDVRLAEADIYNEPGETPPSDAGQETAGAGGDTVTFIQITDLPDILVENTEYPFMVTAAGSATALPSVSCTVSGLSTDISDSNGSFLLTIPDGVVGDATVTCTYASDVTNAQDITVLSQLNATCWGEDLAEGGQDTAADKGYWSDGVCWVLGGGADQNCNDACGILDGAGKCENNIPAQWNDNPPPSDPPAYIECGKCKALAVLAGLDEPEYCLESNEEQAPMLLGTAACKYRNISNTPSQSCTEPALTNERRICACSPTI